MDYILGDNASVFAFGAFSDSVSTQYSTATLCALTYSLSLAADATNYGVTVDSTTLRISVYTVSKALVGTSTTLTLSANSSVVQQETASSTVSFIVSIHDPCPYATITLPFSTLSAMTYTVTHAAAS